MTATRGESLRLLALGCGLLVIYGFISHLPLTRTTVMMPPWVPFMPLMTVPYLLQLMVSWPLLLLVRDSARRRAVVQATVASFSICALCWLFIPTTLSRPILSGADVAGWQMTPYRWLIALDAPNNVFPCGHLLVPILITIALVREQPRYAWWLLPFQLLGAVSIVTTWQHRPVDLAIAAGVAVIAAWICRVGRRQTHTSARPPLPS